MKSSILGQYWWDTLYQEGEEEGPSDVFLTNFFIVQFWSVVDYNSIYRIFVLFKRMDSNVFVNGA